MKDEQIIAEQRTQLMQLREQLKRATTGISLQEVRGLAAMYKPKQTEGKTIGFKVSDEARERLDAQHKKLGAKSYRQVVQTCIELGLRQLEGVSDDANPVEEVPVVPRANDQGDRAVRAAAVG
jgi:predicted DNA-binding protein